MQAVILAAGMGTRLRPLTKTMPKALTEVNGKPLLLNALEVLYTYGITETVIVLGYLGEKIQEICKEKYKKMKITYVWNEEYDITNNNYSLYLARDFITENCILLECDLFYGKELLKDIVAFDGECGILVSDFNPETMDGTVVFANKNDKVYRMELNRKRGEEAEGAKKTVNIYYFSYGFWKNIFMNELENYIRYHNRKNYYEKVLGALIFYGDSDIRIVDVEESLWAEIDNEDDLVLAEEKFSIKER